MTDPIPKKFRSLWARCVTLLKQGKPDDLMHARETVRLIVAYRGRLRFDPDILIPTAIMHDIGHSAILPEHFQYVAGSRKFKNAKLVHMLTGAKIANELLRQLHYRSTARREIVDIISMHDIDQLDITNWRRWYDTPHKRIFHDFDALDRYTPVRLKVMITRNPSRTAVLKELRGLLNNFFFKEFKRTAESNLNKLEKSND
ncbi:MAG: HD domain-containing protein [Candidatus Kerfeldbacteria bacterium]